MYFSSPKLFFTNLSQTIIFAIYFYKGLVKAKKKYTEERKIIIL